MIVFAPLLLQAAPTLTDVGRQALPASGCAAYLWRIGADPLFVAVAGSETLKIAVDGRTATLTRTAVRGESHLGLPQSADYAGEGFVATVDITIVPQPDLADGARVPQGALSVTSAGGDTAVQPVIGLAACAPAVR